MEAVEYRPVRETEIALTADVFTTAVKDMYERHGIKAAPPERTIVEAGYRHIFETGIFQVAEVEGRIAAIGHAVVRDRLWFLSGFWMLPQFQRQGIGGALLRRVRDEGRRAGATTFFTWSSVDTTAMASYMKLGMLPGYQILTFAGPPRATADTLARSESEPLELSHAMQIDEQVRATRREADHNFWLTKAGHEGRQLVLDGRVAGYYYINQGTIGPAAWADEKDASVFLEAAYTEAARDASQVRMMIPGINHTAIRFALNAGLRLTGFSHLLTTAPFGRMEQYLSSGPMLF